MRREKVLGTPCWYGMGNAFTLCKICVWINAIQYIVLAASQWMNVHPICKVSLQETECDLLHSLVGQGASLVYILLSSHWYLFATCLIPPCNTIFGFITRHTPRLHPAFCSSPPRWRERKVGRTFKTLYLCLHMVRCVHAVHIPDPRGKLPTITQCCQQSDRSMFIASAPSVCSAASVLLWLLFISACLYLLLCMPCFALLTTALALVLMRCSLACAS